MAARLIGAGAPSGCTWRVAARAIVCAPGLLALGQAPDGRL
jgi:hypothetical protein